MIKLIDYFAVVGYDNYDSNNQQSSTKNNHFSDENDYLNIDDNYFNTSSLSSSNHQNGIGDELANSKNFSSKGRAKIIQRFPKYPTDNQDEFDSNIHCFCQPHRGWSLYKKQEAPTFFVSVLTDIKGQRRYCATLTFLEPYKSSNKLGSNNHISQNNSNINNDQDDLDSCCEELEDLSSDNNNKRNAIFDINSLITASTKLMDSPIEPCKLYSAKSLVLISRLDYIDLFKSFLSLIYACYVDKRHNIDNKLLETIVANLLTINVNLPGTALQNTFTLGADDKHIVQANASLTVPSTGSCVYKLFKEIGIVNVFKIVCAVAADFKVLFFSRSYTKLYESCKALESLLFPLKYTGVFVPVLPCFGSFLEFPSAPTPYIIGIHSSFRRIIESMHSDSLIECIKVDLDGSHVFIPQCVDDLIMGLDSNHKTNNDLNGKIYIFSF
jgi:myotubularin-related protein 5/13